MDTKDGSAWKRKRNRTGLERVDLIFSLQFTLTLYKSFWVRSWNSPFPVESWYGFMLLLFPINNIVVFLEVCQHPDNIPGWHPTRNKWCRVFVTYFIMCKYTSHGKRGSFKCHTGFPVFPISSSQELLLNIEHNTEKTSLSTTSFTLIIIKINKKTNK